MLRWYKCAEFCILKGQNCVAWFGHGCSGIALTGTRTELWFGHGCSGELMLLEHERNYGLGMDALVISHSLRHERNYGLGMDALVSVCSWNTNGIMVWAWMLW